MDANDPEINPDDEFTELEREVHKYLSSGIAPDEGPLAFVNLQKAGRTDLMSGIIKFGGYAGIAERMGLDASLFMPPLSPAKSKAFPGFYQSDDGAALALGRDLDARLDSIESVDKTNTNGKQRAYNTVSRVTDDVPSAQQLLLQNEKMAPRIVDKAVPLGETFALSAEMRIGLLMLTTVATLGFGRASVDLLSGDVQAICQSLTYGLTVAHVSLAFYTVARLAPKLERDRALWFVKVLLSGPLGVRSLRALGPIGSEIEHSS